MAQSLNDQDVYLYRSSDPHTAIPDWLPRCSLVSPEARFMAVTILVLSKAPMPPTRAEIAESMGVDIRTVQRWLGELRSAGLLSEHQVGRRVLCVFERPMGDPCVMGDRGVTRHTDHPTHGSPMTPNMVINYQSIRQRQTALFSKIRSVILPLVLLVSNMIR